MDRNCLEKLLLVLFTEYMLVVKVALDAIRKEQMSLSIEDVAVSCNVSLDVFPFSAPRAMKKNVQFIKVYIES